MNSLVEKSHNLKDEQEKVQTKTFTKWINSHLCRLKPPIVVKDLMSELKDGIVLLNLLEILSEKPLKKEQPKHMQRIHCITNVNAALQFMEKEKKIKLVNINASDIVDGKPAIVLGLVWTAILHLQIEEQEDILLKALGLENDPNSKGKTQTKQGLLAWSNKALTDKYGLKIKDFGESWCDGKAFNALVHNIDPSLIDMDAMENQTNKERLTNAFNIAESELGIPKLLDVEDVDVEKPDERSIMTYVSQFLKSYPEGKKTDEEDIIATKTNASEMAANLPLSDLDKVKEFNVNVGKSCEDPDVKDDYEVFHDLMNQRDDVKRTLENLHDETNKDVDEDDLRKANEEFQRTDLKLKEWQWNLDQNLPGKLGSEISAWLQKAENCLMQPLPDCRDNDFNDKIINQLKEHEKVFNDKNKIVAHFKEIKKNPPANVPLQQLEDIENRLLNVINEEEKAKEMLNLFALQAQLQNKADKWDKDIESWNAPIKTKDDVIKRMEKFKESTGNGNSVADFTNKLGELIEDKVKFCEENPNFNENLLEYLNQSIIKCEEQNDELPEKFDAARTKLQKLSTAWKDIDDAELKIDNYLQRVNNALEKNDLQEQKILSENLPEIMDLVNATKQKIEKQIMPHCAPELAQSMRKKINDSNDKIKSLSEEMINRLEKQEQEEVRQQEAAKEIMIANLISDNKADTKEIQDWLNEFDKCIGSPIDGTSENLEDALKTLENLDRNAPEIQNLINQGYQAVTELRSLNEPEKASELKRAMDDLQKKFLNYKEKEIPKSLNSLRAMIETAKSVEQGINDLEKFNREGNIVKECLEKPESTNNADSKKQEFVGKKKEIINSIAKDKDLLKKLQDMSKNSNLHVDLRPLEDKIAASESSLQDLLEKTEGNIIASKQCNEACKNAFNFLEDLSNKIVDDKPNKKDEESQRAKLNKLETMEQDLAKAEDLIKEADNKRNQVMSKLTKAELKKIDEEISKMKKNAADLKNNVQLLKSEAKEDINNWQDFQQLKDSVASDLDKTVNDLEKSHKKRKGLHGENSKDKADLLEENNKRLQALNHQEKEIKDLFEKAKKLGADKPMAEAQELLKRHQKQKEDLEKEIKQNETDLLNHQQLDKQVDAFTHWLKDTEKVADIIENLPNTKEGLIEKQKRLQQLNQLKSQGDKMLKDLKSLQNIVLNQTAPDHRDAISSNISQEVNRFNNIFGNLDQQQDVNETIDKLENIDQRSNQVSDVMDELSNKIDKCLHLPNDTVNEKEKVGKELNNLNRLLDQQRSQIQELKKQCQSLDKCEAAQDLLDKLEALEQQCEQCQTAVLDRISDNENELKQQSALEERLNDFADLMNETEEEMNRCAPGENSEVAIEDSLKKLSKLKSKHAPVKELLEHIIKAQQTFSAPKQCVDACDNSEQKYFNLEEEMKQLEEKLELKLNDWTDYNSLKDSVKTDLDSVSRQLDDSHRKRNGIHGGDCNDKNALLTTNKERLACLKKCEEKLNNLVEMAKDLGSDKAMSEVVSLKNNFKKQKEELEKEVKQNEKDLEDHKRLDNSIESFKKFLQNSEKEINFLESIPNNINGLMEKQGKLEDLNKLKSRGKEMLQDLKSLQTVVLNETSADHKNDINSKITKEIDRFNKLFGHLDQDQDSIKETIDNLQKMNGKTQDIMEAIDEADGKFENCLSLPNETMDDKEKIGKMLRNLDQSLDHDKNRIQDLKRQCEKLGKNDAVEEFIEKLNKMEKKCDTMKAEINQKTSSNAENMKHQLAFNNKLEDLQLLMEQINNEMETCLPKECNETSISDGLKKLEKIKSRHKQGKNILDDMKKSNKFLKDSSQMSEAVEDSELKYNDIEDEIIKLENKLETQKNDWFQFNSEKEDLNKWLDSVSTDMDWLVKKNDGNHAGKISEKEQLLEAHRKLLQDVLNHEAEIRILIDRSTPLLSGTNQDPNKRMTNTVCKKYEKLLEDLSDKVKQNEDDLTKHERYRANCKNFKDENNVILKNFNEKIATLPNTKEGLKQKWDLYENMKDTYNQRKVLLVNLEKEKNIVIDQTSPYYYQDLDKQWDEIVDNFEKYFNLSGENQSKLLMSIQQIEKTEAGCEDLSKSLEKINENINAVIQQPLSSIDDIEQKLQALQDLECELKQLQNPLNDLNRKQTPNTNEFIKQKIDKLTDHFKETQDLLNANLMECENLHKQQCNIVGSLNNFKTWLDRTVTQVEDRSKVTNLDLKNLKVNLNSLKALRNDIAEHKVELSRLQNSVDSVLNNSKDNSLQLSLNEITEKYNDILSLCYNESEKCDNLIALMNKFDSSRSKVLHWIESNTQVLLSCSDYTLKPSQMKSKLLIIENLEKDLENNGKAKFIEAIQDGDELMKELSDIPLDLVSQQISDLKSNWTEMTRQLNQLLNNLRNSTSRSEAFKDMSNRLSTWLNDIEHTGLMDTLSIEHQCEIPLEDTHSSNKYERIKILLMELNRRKPDFLQLSNMASDLANPSFDMENSQIQNRFTRLQINLKDKIEKLSRQQADYDKIKQEIEEMEKWIFQMSMKIINENADQGANMTSNIEAVEDLIHRSSETIDLILAKEQDLLRIRQSMEFILNGTDIQEDDKNKDLHEDFIKLKENFNNLKDNAIHKRDHLTDSAKKWENFQKFLESTKSFLEKELPKWWIEKSQSIKRPNFSIRDNDSSYKDIVEMENKLNGLKRTMENEAKECEGILPTVAASLSRSHTPNFTSGQASPSDMSLFINGSANNSDSQKIFEELEDNIKKLADFKREHQERTSDWNNFNREKNSLKNWMDNEVLKLSSTLQSNSGITNVEAFQRKKLKDIQDEINSKKPILSNLNERFCDLTSNGPRAVDPGLKELNRDFENAIKEINKFLNREDKEVEANFTDEDSNFDTIQKKTVPKLNLENLGIQCAFDYETPGSLHRFTQTNSFRDEVDCKKNPSTFSAYSQTPVTKTTQTYGDGGNNKRRKREEMFSNIHHKIKDIGDKLQRSVPYTDYSFNQNLLLSPKPRFSNQESVRKNMISSRVYNKPLSPRYENDIKSFRSLSSRPPDRDTSKYMPPSEIRKISKVSQNDLDYYIPTKNKWHSLETNSQNSLSWTNSNHPTYPNREFQIDYNVRNNGSLLPSSSRRSGRKSNKSRSRISTHDNSKTSRLNESMKRISDDADQLRMLSERLKSLK